MAGQSRFASGHWYRHRGKRLVDLVGAGVALVLTAPVLLVAWAAVRLTSPGPVLFRQERVGHGGTGFVLLKFRTMYVDTDDSIHRAYVTRMLTEGAPERGGDRGLFKLEQDPRVTRVGDLLRRTSIDELPQLFNVLRGEMSLVGPRPCLPWERDLYNERDLRRFDVLPGITGLWQVSGRSTLSMRQALDMDVDYAEHQSMTLDVSILARTVPSLLRSEAS
jgi:lipopolysaccharide/colanic/teichoic acid biosynthesis glycosyltransferase